jgi:hypothetical protein
VGVARKEAVKNWVNFCKAVGDVARLEMGIPIKDELRAASCVLGRSNYRLILFRVLQLYKQRSGVILWIFGTGEVREEKAVKNWVNFCKAVRDVARLEMGRVKGRVIAMRLSDILAEKWEGQKSDNFTSEFSIVCTKGFGGLLIEQ